MKLFPHILVRLGGVPFSELQQPDLTDLVSRSQQLDRLTREKAQRKVVLSENLLQYMQQMDDAKARNQVQNVRRAIFNERNVKPERIEEVRQYLKEALAQQLTSYIEFDAYVGECTEKASLTYNREVWLGRCHLQTLAQNDSLQKGLILSSRTFLNSLRNYQQKDPYDFRNKEVYTEHSLLKYLTRMGAKTSPFSTFNNLALAELREQVDNLTIGEPKVTNGQAGTIVGHIRLNNHLFKYLQSLLFANRTVYRRLRIRPNPTINRQTGCFAYLTNHENVEAFQRLPDHPVVALLLDIASQEKAGIRFDALLAEALESVDAPEEAMEGYIKQLLDYGFLEYNLGVSGLDPDWNLKLAEQLQPLIAEGIPHLDQLAEALQYIVSLSRRYALAGVVERQEILEKAFSSFQSTCMILHEEAGLPAEERQPREVWMAEYQTRLEARQKAQMEARQEARAEADSAVEVAQAKAPKEFRHQSLTYFPFTAEQLFYEDTTQAITLAFDRHQVQAFVEKVDMLLTELQFFKGYKSEKDKIQHFFLQKYGLAGHPSLLTFYEAYYREVKMPEAKQLAGQNEDSQKENNSLPPDELPATQLWKQLVSRWMEHFFSKIRPALTNGSDEVVIRLEMLKKVNQALAIPCHPLTNSTGILVQFFQSSDENGKPYLSGVLNSVFGGYSKATSRFMHLFPETLTEDARAWNATTADEGCLFLENSDASYFNANIHPPMLPYNIRVPGGHSSLPANQQLPVTDFEVQYDDTKEEMKLVYQPTGRRAYVFDLGLEGTSTRSPLYQLLENFTQATYISTQPITNTINSARKSACSMDTKGNGQQIVVLPRIVYEEQIILQRKSWLVPKALIPVRQPTDTDAAYYLSLNTWRRQNGIADEVFVFVNPPRGTHDKTDPKLLENLRRDDYKPQYIHFNNPLLVGLFEKIVGKVPVTLKIEEMLPQANHLLSLAGQAYVSECVLQWNTHAPDENRG